MPEVRYVHDAQYHNSNAALRIVPLIIDLFHPKTVLDVGCGTGDFLKVFIDNGVNDVQGIDGEWLDENKLVIDRSVVATLDLEKPFDLSRRFDVVLCLEVAEHLHEEFAEQFVDSLVAHGNVIVFSAAVPHQGGQHHVNEQWIDYWKVMFEKHNFHLYDLIRPRIWNDEEIFWWYRQNIFVCVKDGSSFSFPKSDALSFIHPELYLAKVWQMNAYKEWIDKIITGNIEVELAQAILHNAIKRSEKNI